VLVDSNLSVVRVLYVISKPPIVVSISQSPNRIDFGVEDLVDNLFISLQYKGRRAHSHVVAPSSYVAAVPGLVELRFGQGCHVLRRHLREFLRARLLVLGIGVSASVPSVHEVGEKEVSSWKQEAL
jgi:hypothetical protein